MAANAADPSSPSSSPDQNASSTLRLPRLLRERVGDGQHRRGARRVVVGAEMDLAGFVLAGERVAGFAVAEVIVVRAERDPRLRDAGRRRRRRQVGDDVVAGLLLAHDSALTRARDVGKAKPADVRIAGVERLLRPSSSVLPAACETSRRRRRR